MNKQSNKAVKFQCVNSATLIGNIQDQKMLYNNMKKELSYEISADCSIPEFTIDKCKDALTNFGNLKEMMTSTMEDESSSTGSIH